MVIDDESPASHLGTESKCFERLAQTADLADRAAVDHSHWFRPGFVLIDGELQRREYEVPGWDAVCLRFLPGPPYQRPLLPFDGSLVRRALESHARAHGA